MSPLYLYVLLGSFSIPFLYTFLWRDFIKKWKNFTISTFCIAGLFIFWDYFFTHFKIWGFEDHYILGYHFFKMPVEEWLFFLVIPFCSLFTHFAFLYAFPKVFLSKKTTLYLTLFFILLSLFIVIFNFDKWYTFINFSSLFLVLVLGLYRLKLLQQFYISFLIILIPFFIVNGILTGMLTAFPVVWYDDSENLGLRLITIPIEDIGYAFSMLFGNLLIFDMLNKQKRLSYK
ncbi:lycopene cyclase domain-containing protein [Bacteroidota bacterium]